MIRQFNALDWPDVMKIERECFPKNRRFRRGAYQHLLDKGARCLVWDLGDGALGAVWFHESEIVSLGVLPEHCGLGIGRALLSWAFREMRQSDRDTAFLYVEPTNPSFVPALRLYIAVGFLPGRFDPDYYSKGVGGLYMEKNLHEPCGL